ncbi:cache domain-containing protein [Methylobacterium sp. J-076]|uniref:cache domain-containing protein n=1 Tax=Methylobacterium sp. J-076 TaxID=2836655 RepID=UPI001FBABDE3|nr:cache domain-containing protein [Methylobacterium sp. J-076]MCJ2012781.1 cache domain-containing protein [Methylobacterium sp. J-076]
MRLRFPICVAAFAFGSAPYPAALACGDSEAGLSCDDSGSGAEMGAKWMLNRATKAVATDKTKALTAFTKGTDGFRTADSYVFCVGPDGVMTAHPNPILQGHDVHDLHDKTGNYFIKTMVQDAKSGQISMIRYLFPKPGSTIEEPKTTYYTKAGDQMCAVGIYDSDAASPQVSTPEGRVASLRAKLDAEIPAAARADWTAFLEALNQVSDAKAATMSLVRDNLQAAEAALGATDGKAAKGR